MTEHILLVDDNEDFLAAGREFLTSQGYRVSIASNGEAALASVAADRPDIILMDVMMPRMDGWDTLKVLQDDEQTVQIPVLMLTALRGTDPVKQSFDRGSVWFYATPIRAYHALLLVIRPLVDAKRHPAE